MFVLNENESEALAYNDITSVSVAEKKEGFLVKAESKEKTIVLVRFKEQPRLGPIISSMWYANIRGAAKWQYSDPA